MPESWLECGKDAACRGKLPPAYQLCNRWKIIINEEAGKPAKARILLAILRQEDIVGCGSTIFPPRSISINFLERQCPDGEEHPRMQETLQGYRLFVVTIKCLLDTWLSGIAAG